jgi:hypothetical protein
MYGIGEYLKSPNNLQEFVLLLRQVGQTRHFEPQWKQQAFQRLYHMD